MEKKNLFDLTQSGLNTQCLRLPSLNSRLAQPLVPGLMSFPPAIPCSVLGITDVNSAQDGTRWRTHCSFVTNSQGEMQL